MKCCGLGLAVVSALSLAVVLDTGPARAQAAVWLGMTGSAHTAAADAMPERAQPVIHQRRARSYYCYPRNYWWFYRPYTTAKDGHARCMPYFHYLHQETPPYFKRGPRHDRLK